MPAQTPFDAMSDKVFETVEATMGYDGSWLPFGSGTTQTARVLYGEPTKEEKLGDFGDAFTPETRFMEYWDGSFDGLFESVRSGVSEHVFVNGEEYYVADVQKKYDGRNYRARLEPKQA